MQIARFVGIEKRVKKEHKNSTGIDASPDDHPPLRNQKRKKQKPKREQRWQEGASGNMVIENNDDDQIEQRGKTNPNIGDRTLR